MSLASLSGGNKLVAARVGHLFVMPAATLELVCGWGLGLLHHPAWHWSQDPRPSSSSVAPQGRARAGAGLPLPSSSSEPSRVALRAAYLHSSRAFMRAMKE